MIAPEDQFLTLANAGRNVFLTGMAGTGKSYLLRRFVEAKRAAGEPVAVTAPTGMAALNVGGQTVHRWAGILLGARDGETFGEAFFRLANDRRPNMERARRRVLRAECLVIDEVSMLPGRQLDFLNFWMRRLRSDDRPFGGCQVIVIGDFLQLPPVKTDPKSPYDWAFAGSAWGEAGFELVRLTRVRRQDDPQFVGALGQFRIGHVIGETARLFAGRVTPFPSVELTRLLPRNSMVDKWNKAMLDELPGEERLYVAETGGNPAEIEYLCKNLTTPRELRLKRGARVMFTRNDSNGQWVNGSTGVVEDLGDETVLVRLNDNAVMVAPQMWESDAAEPKSFFRQLPLRLAYAVTIHKAQGCTLDGAYVDIRAAREPGQAYVAVSRVRTLGGLHLKEMPKGVWVSREAMQFYQQT